MTPILGFLIVLGAAVIGSLVIFPRVNPQNPIISGLAVSGIPYILTGLLLGPQVFNFLSVDILQSLEPLLSLTLGWAGLLFGIHLRWRNIKRYPPNYTLFTAVQSLLSFVIILGICWYALDRLGGFSSLQILELSLILGAIGCNTTPITIARTILVHKASGRLTHLMQFVSGLDGVWGIVISGITFALFNSASSNWVTSNWQWILVYLVFGILFGLAYVYLIRQRFDNEEMVLLVLGLVIFTSGVGFYLHLSPIFLNMIVGVVIAQFRREAEKTVRILSYAETPIYLILLLYAGAVWKISLYPEIFVFLIFVGARFIGKYFGGWVSASTIDCRFPIPKNVGFILQSFGGLSLAIALNFKLFESGEMGNLIITAAILGTVIFDEFAAWSTPRILKRQGEIR